MAASDAARAVRAGAGINRTLASIQLGPTYRPKTDREGTGDETDAEGGNSGGDYPPVRWEKGYAEDGTQVLYGIDETGQETGDVRPLPVDQGPSINVPAISEGFRNPFTGSQTQMNRNTDIPLADPRAGVAFGKDPAEYQNINALHDAGLMTDKEYREALLGVGGYSGDTGGGGSGVGYAQLDLARQQFAYQQEQDALDRARQEKQDELNLILNRLQEVRAQQTLNTQTAQNNTQNMISAAPNLNDGRQYFGGYEPGGPAQALAQFSGYQFNPQPLRTVPVTFNPNPAPVDPATLAILDRLMGGQ